MTPFIALLLAVAGTEPRVTGLTVAPVADRTEVVILIDGSVTPRHFMLEDGRLVVDLDGVSGAPSLDMRDFNRGGVRELRMSAFQPTVARLVLALAARVEYDVVRTDGGIRISFPNRGGAFDPWNRALSAAASAPASAPASASAGRAPQIVHQPPTAAAPIVMQQERRITINFLNEPVNSVLSVFSEYAGRTIIASPSIQGRSISAELRDVPWQEGLEAILQAYGLMIRTLPSGIMLVEDASAAQDRRDSEPTVTQTFQIQYIGADSIRPAVAGLLTSTGRVTVNKSSNALLVTDVQSAVQRVADVIPLLDTQTPQVDIRATIAFVDRTALESLGVVYDLKDSRGSQFNRVVSGFADLNGDGVIDPSEAITDDRVLLGGNSVAALGNANYRVVSPAFELVSTLVLGRHSLVTFLEALQTVSLSDIQAHPMVRTMDHRQANIQVGEQTPIRVIDAGSGAAAGTQQARATVTMQNTGVILNVTPHITGDQVMLELHAERSNVAAATSDIGLIFQTQNATTQVLVNDGETVVIGGLTIIEKTKSRAGIPLLMDLPVIGALFRNETERENKRDLLIMVTPHIVRD